MRGTGSLGRDRRRTRSDAEDARKVISLVATPGLKQRATGAGWTISGAIEPIRFSKKLYQYSLIGAVNPDANYGYV